MKQTRYYCDRCKEDCGIDGEKLYPERLQIKLHTLDLCKECLNSFNRTFDEWINK